MKAPGLSPEGEGLRLQAVGLVHQQLNALAPVQHLPPPEERCLPTALQRSPCEHSCICTAAAAADLPGLVAQSTSNIHLLAKVVIHTECIERWKAIAMPKVPRLRWWESLCDSL